jgi:hypothetical protein
MKPQSIASVPAIPALPTAVPVSSATAAQQLGVSCSKR